MLKAILIILLAVVSNSSAAGWLEVGKSEISKGDLVTSYIDPASIRRVDNMVRIMILTDLSAVHTSNGKSYLSGKVLYEFDCTEGGQRMRTLSYSSFTGNMGEGQEESVVSTPGKWESVVPGSTGDNYSKFACMYVKGSASAEWVAVGNTDNGTAYANLSNMQKRGNRVKMWSMMDFKTALEFNSGSYHMSTLSFKKLKEYDCKEKKSRKLSYSMFSGNMGGGEVNYSESVSDKKWEPVPTESIDEIQWEFACGKRVMSASQKPS